MSIPIHHHPEARRFCLSISAYAFPSTTLPLVTAGLLTCLHDCLLLLCIIADITLSKHSSHRRCAVFGPSSTASRLPARTAAASCKQAHSTLVSAAARHSQSANFTSAFLLLITSSPSSHDLVAFFLLHHSLSQLSTRPIDPSTIVSLRRSPPSTRMLWPPYSLAQLRCPAAALPLQAI